jgi:antitoxin ParD1/3/4
MTAHAVQLPDDLDAFVRAQVEAGSYASPDEVILAGVRRFKAQAEDEAQRLARFHEAVQIGLDQIERGEGLEVTDIRAFISEIEAEVEAEFADRAA